MNNSSWLKLISSIEFPFSKLKPNKNNVKKALVSSIEKLPEKYGILFSGGLDSNIIALLSKNKKVTCYCVGLEGSQDIEWAKKSAKLLNLKLKVKTYTLKEVERSLKKVVKILKTNDVTKVSVGLTVYLAMKLVKEKHIVTGLGAEEIFAGYHRHKKANSEKELFEESWAGLKRCYKNDIERDTKIAKALKKKVFTPFLDKDLIIAAMHIKPKDKIKKGYKKYILRQIAEELGLPEELAFRKRKAAQYGSNILKAIEKLSKKAGYKYKKDYLSSICESFKYPFTYVSNMLLNKNSLDILEGFSNDYNKRIYGTNIAKKLKMNQKTVSNILNKLEKQDILKFSCEGKNKYYFLNKFNSNIKEVIKLIEIEKKIKFVNKNNKFKELFNKLEEKAKGILIVFGSYSTYTNTKKSDLDLFVAGKISEVDDLEELYNIKINVIKSNKQKFNKEEHIIQEIIKNHIILKGVEEFIDLIWQA